MVVRYSWVNHAEQRNLSIVISVRSVPIFFQDGGWHNYFLHFGTAGNGAKVFFDELHHLSWFYIAANSQRRIVWSIPTQKEILQIIQTKAIQFLNIADS